MNINTSTNVSMQSADVATYQNTTRQTEAHGGQTEAPVQLPIGNNLSMVEAIEKANHIETGTTECQFSIHEKTNQIMIKIVDQQTKEVIKELPSEKVLDMVAKMCDLAGVFVDTKR